MKETDSLKYSTDVQKVCDSLLRVVPQEYFPAWPIYPKQSIAQTLKEANSSAPSLSELIGAIVKEETKELLVTLGELSLKERFGIESSILSLPSMPAAVNHEKPLKPFDLFLFKHDIGQQFDILWLSKTPAIEKFMKSHQIHGRLNYRYEEVIGEEKKSLIAPYSLLLRSFAEQSVLPSIQNALKDKNPKTHYLLHELRSGYRELAGLPSTAYTEKFRLGQTVEQFINDNKFRDKNTKKPVEVSLDSSSTNPEVYMDLGDLYRMLRNLLRDAVTHGTNPIILPVVKIDSKSECAYLSVYSPGTLEDRVLRVIGRESYTSQDQGDKPHGYGKVGARKLLEALWKSLGTTDDEINRLFAEHWSNKKYKGLPNVCWQAPIPKVS